MCCSTDVTIKVINTKPMLVVFEWFVVIFNLETWVTWNRNSAYIFVKVDPCFAFKPNGFLECWTLNCKILWASFNMPLAINTNFSFNSRPLRNTKGNKLWGLEGDCWMHTSSTLLGTTIRTITRGRKKFTQLGWWESLFVLRGKWIGHFAVPKTSSPSKWIGDLWRKTQTCNLWHLPQV